VFFGKVRLFCALFVRKISVVPIFSRLLSHGDWMLFKGKGGEGDSQMVWLGRAVSKTEWSNQCIWKNETGRDLIAGQVRVARNE
jgi:hypothetical protein